MITCSDIGEGDRLGAQMRTLACLLWLGGRTGHEVVFHNEVRYASQGLQFLDVFDLPIHLLPEHTLSIVPRTLFALSRPVMRRFWQLEGERRWRCAKTVAFVLTRLGYHLLRILHRHSFAVPPGAWAVRLNCDQMLISLLATNPDRNFDIRCGRLGSYQDWKETEQDILAMFRFKPAIVSSAVRRFAEYCAILRSSTLTESVSSDNDFPKVSSPGFRLTLLLSSLPELIPYNQLFSRSSRNRSIRALIDKPQPSAMAAARSLAIH